MKRASILLLVLPLVASPHLAAAKECVGIAALRDARSAGLINNLNQFMRRKSDADSPDCAALVSVMNKVMSRSRTGGRRLEGDTPFDPAAAQANLEKALRDPETGKRLAKLHDEVKDEALRLYLEAVLLDEDGYYAARELRIQQLQQRLQ